MSNIHPHLFDLKIVIRVGLLERMR